MNRSSNTDVQAEQLRRHQKALADFGLEAFRSEDLDALLGQAAHRVSEALGVELVKIMELLPHRHELLIRAGVNWRPGVVHRVTLSAGADSPAGYALLHNEAVISPDVSTETRFPIPPVLAEHGVHSMVNVIIAGDEQPFGVLEVDARQARHFDEDDIAFLRNYANLLAAAVARLRTHARLSEALEHRHFLMLELQHRVKNILAVVQALAADPSVEGRTIEAFRGVFLERLRALAEAHGLLFGGENAGATLRELVEKSVRPFRTGSPEVFVIEGDETSIGPKQGLTLGLILHELCTNAARHGALSRSAGHVHITWRQQCAPTAEIRLEWEERGGPAVRSPDRQGFGTRVIERLASHDLGGKATLDYRSAGLVCEIVFPPSLEDRP